MATKFKEGLAQDNVQSSVDAAVTIKPTTRFLDVSTTGAGTRVITLTSMLPGQEVHIWMSAQATGTYTATVNTGTLTFNAADEMATVFFDGTNYHAISLNGATVV